MIDSPSGGAPKKAPRWDLTGTKGCGGGNRVSWCSSVFSGYVSIYIGEGSRSGEPRGAHEGGGRSHPPREHLTPLWPPRLLLDVHSKSPGLRLFQKDRSQRFHSIWTPFDIPFLRNTEIGKKIAIRVGPPVSRLVPKMI